jgi:hypothetical protein
MARIYALVDAREPEHFRYVGKTVREIQERLYFHLYRQPAERNLHKKRWIIKVQDAGGDVIPVLLEECADDVQDEREIFWIAKARAEGHRLTNMTDGGEGGRNPCPEVREKIAAAHRGKKRPPHVREALSAAAKLRTGATNPNFGKRWSKAQRDHLASIKRVQYAGDGNPASKISEADAIEIFRLRSVDRVPVKEICAQFGIGKSSVHNITSGVTWTHLNLLRAAA